VARKRAVAAAASRGARIPAIDALRGAAIVAMIGYHFAFDLRWFNVTRADFEHDPFWLTARALIVTSFLALVGVSLVLAERAGTTRAQFARRIAMIAACAIAVSIGSYFAFPGTWIHFGILHCIVVASLLAWPLRQRPRLALVLGMSVIVAGLAFSHPAFDGRTRSWIGFTTFKPPTEDYVPLFPWAGVVFVGIALGDAFARRGFAALGWLARAPDFLRWLGRHSLAVYMIHQPVMIGALWLLLRR
jgi:uncharacterized membrane protein